MLCEDGTLDVKVWFGVFLGELREVGWEIGAREAYIDVVSLQSLGRK